MFKTNLWGLGYMHEHMGCTQVFMLKLTCCEMPPPSDIDWTSIEPYLAEWVAMVNSW